MEEAVEEELEVPAVVEVVESEVPAVVEVEEGVEELAVVEVEEWVEELAVVEVKEGVEEEVEELWILEFRAGTSGLRV